MGAGRIFGIVVLAAVILAGCGDKKSKGEQSSEAAGTASASADTVAAENGLDAEKAAKLTSYVYTGRTVKIGSQTWMASNLNYNVPGSKCYGEGGKVGIGYANPAELTETTLSDKEVRDNCDKYGRLYDWSMAMAACPAGWRLPNDDDWTELVNYAGGKEKADKKLKSKTGWNDNSNGTDDYGFSALPGGRGLPSLSFYNAGYKGVWWSATERDADDAWHQYIDYAMEYVFRDNGSKSELFSVRCVQDK